ncbi:MAG: hypothetical protein ACRERD_16145 [Candidatus Binatia bacterium]
MYTLIRNVGLRTGMLKEAPSLFLSMLIAEGFFKFHSFTLECIAFLVTWYAVSGLCAWWAQRIGPLRQRPQLSKAL